MCEPLPGRKSVLGRVPLLGRWFVGRPTCPPPCVEDRSRRSWFRRQPLKCVMPTEAPVEEKPVAKEPVKETPAPKKSRGVLSRVTTMVKGGIYVLILFFGVFARSFLKLHRRPAGFGYQGWGSGVEFLCHRFCAKFFLRNLFGVFIDLHVWTLDCPFAQLYHAK